MGGKEETHKGLFFKASFKKGQIKFDLIVNTLWNDTIVIFKNDENVECRHRLLEAGDFMPKTFSLLFIRY